MSAISATGINLSSLFQSVPGQSAAASVQTSGTAADPAAASPTTPAHKSKGGGGHRHHHGGMFGQIQQAVTSALQSAQSDSSSDPNQVVQDAITKVLQQITTGSGASPTDLDGEGDGSSTGASSSADGQSFSQMLQTMGVSPQQFHSDFLAAVQAAQGGQVDPGMAFQSFPPGSTVDTVG